jgi:hypothetical protein
MNNQKAGRTKPLRSLRCSAEYLKARMVESKHLSNVQLDCWSQSTKSRLAKPSSPIWRFQLKTTSVTDTTPNGEHKGASVSGKWFWACRKLISLCYEMVIGWEEDFTTTSYSGNIKAAAVGRCGSIITAGFANPKIKKPNNSPKKTSNVGRATARSGPDYPVGRYSRQRARSRSRLTSPWARRQPWT